MEALFVAYFPCELWQRAGAGGDDDARESEWRGASARTRGRIYARRDTTFVHANLYVDL